MNTTLKLTALLLVAAFALTGCGDDPEGSDNADPIGSSAVTTVDNGNGTFSTTVDATSTATGTLEDWVFMSLSTGEQVPYTPGIDQQLSWDVAFNRFSIMVNGGVSGAGDVGVAFLEGVDFMNAGEAPDAVYLGDQPDADGDGTPEYVFGEWYSYDSVNHVLTPKDRVYFVKALDGSYYKIAMTDYYDNFGTSGFPQFDWGTVSQPQTGGKPVDASGSDTWVYFSLTQNDVVNVTDEMTSLEWDLAFQRTNIRTNSGVSGMGAAGAALGDGTPYDQVVSTLPYGFKMDVIIPASGAPGSVDMPGNPVLADWYDYDFATHTVTPKDVTFHVRSAKGGYFKVRIESYSSGKYMVRTAPITMTSPEETMTMDASVSDKWVYFSFREGDYVTPADPANDLSWDIAVSRTSFATNSGVSGPGMGGALIGAYPEFENISQAPESGFIIDEMITPEQPGAQPYPGNPLLAEWYDYDFATHTVTPKDETYVIRTADGLGYGKFKIYTYGSGVYDIDWQYTGAGLTDFDTSGGRPE